jgi:RNA polymerase sigma-70 factor (ECF subfamily)
MATSDNEPNPGMPKREWFVTTSWTNLMLARQEGTPEAGEALERLCAAYWYPLYAYVRRSGHSAEDAEDLTQAFFTQILEKNYLGAADRRKGKFRSFLLAALNHFLCNEWDYRKAAKRGGGKPMVSLDEKTPEDRYLLEPSTDVSPETIFENRWAHTVLDQARRKMREEYAAPKKQRQFELLQSYLIEDAGPAGYADVAGELGMNPNSVAVTVHRMRQRFGELVREEVGRTVARPEEVDSEMRHLCDVVGAVSF